MADTVADFVAKLGLSVNASSFALGDRLLGGIKTAVAALAVYEGIHVLTGWVQQTEDAAVGASHMAEKLGISTDAVQELGFAATHAGANAEQLQVGMQRLARGFEEAKTKGSGPFAEALAKLKVPMSEIKNASLDDVLMRISDGFADAGPNVNKTALAMDLMGRGGTALLPLLNLGADGIAELRRRAHELGAVIDGETIKSFKDFEEKQKDLSAGLTGLRNTMVAALLPALTELTEGALKWFEANRVELTRKLASAFAFLGKVIHVVGQAIGFLAPVFEVVVDIFGAAWSVLERVYDSVAKLVDENESLRYVLEAVAVVAAVVALALEAPWLLAIAGVAALILIVEDLYEMFTGGPSYLEIWFDYLDDKFENELPGAVRVLWNVQKGFWSFLRLELQWVLYLLDKVKTYFEWMSENGKDLLSIVGGPVARQALDWAGRSGNDQKKLDADRDAEIAAHPGIISALRGGTSSDTTSPTGGATPDWGSVMKTFGTPGLDMIPTISKTTNVGSPTFQITLNGVNGTPAEIGQQVRDHMDDFWNTMLRQTDAQTEKP